jgi:hypothetical protein
VTAGGDHGGEVGAVARDVEEQCCRGQVGVDGFGRLGEEPLGSGEGCSVAGCLLAAASGARLLDRAAGCAGYGGSVR